MFNQKISKSTAVGKTVAIFLFLLAQLLPMCASYSQDQAVSSVDKQEMKVVTNEGLGTNEIINLGSNVNSRFSDFCPRITTDGKALYFCRKVRNEKAESEFRRLMGIAFSDFVLLPDAERKRLIERAASRMALVDRLKLLLALRDIDGQEEIYVSFWRSDEWTEAVSVGSPLNSEDSNEAPESISTDNNQFFIFKNADICLSQRLGATWSKPTKVEEPINSQWWEGDICFSSDGLTLFFVSKRPGFTTSATDTAGNHDIWVTVKKDGRWTAPVNLGPTINTPQSERTPFLHADGKTLYFASDGHGGKGKLDLFKTTRLSDSSWTEWAKPVNLERLNTSSEDWDLTMPANSEWAYFSSEKAGGFGQKDLYKFRVDTTDTTIAPARPVTLIAGVVTSPNGEPLEAEIRWEDLGTGKLMGVATSNLTTGEYTIALPAGRRYGYYATKENYWDKSENIDLTNLRNYKELQVNIQLIPMMSLASEEKGQAAGPEIVLKNIFFEFASANLDSASYSELNRMAQKLVKHEEIKIEVQGHTDSVGTSVYNKVLSQKRADTVRSYWISKGIHPRRLTAVGYGEDSPIDTNATEEGRQNNRRVSFVEIQTVSTK